MQVLVRLEPADKEWARRAIRSVFEDAADQARYFHLLDQIAGYAGPMSTAEAADFSFLLLRARTHGGVRWRNSMERVATKFDELRFKVSHRKSSGNIAAGIQVPRIAKLPKARCPDCHNMIDGQPMGVGFDWFCPSCDVTVIPEGEA
jgi:hypothetical protein